MKDQQLKTLDELGLEQGTDKASRRGEDLQGHDYLRHYEHFLAGLRGEQFDLMEIGVLGGASIRMWLDYFPHCRILGVDITETCKSYESERVRIDIGRHDDIAFIRNVAANNAPMVIVDDGSHIWAHQIDLFETLFPSVLPGGWYICEDLQVCFGPSADKYGIQGGRTSAAYFAQIAERVLGDRPGRFATPMERYALSWIDAMYFCRGAVVISKRRRELFALEQHPRAKLNPAQRPVRRPMRE